MRTIPFQRNLLGRLWAVQQMLDFDSSDRSKERLAKLLRELTDPQGLGRFGTSDQAQLLVFKDASPSIVFEREEDRDLVLQLVHALWGDPLDEDFDNRPADSDEVTLSPQLATSGEGSEA